MTLSRTPNERQVKTMDDLRFTKIVDKLINVLKEENVSLAEFELIDLSFKQEIKRNAKLTNN
jgi:hypothetical protein